ncbi:amidohydrolase family protein [Auraticoccus monumenti]|uniref:Imidazolonepropionase n=1 Tax=Auraticoccus monumenti TaxID=675864 RepID=A0A1G7D505_9ACTN|nr:amidohydrolase family protein [Auraticoccus monumenti]SDE46601.1 Imidazolonepropionase [Auraticoccus monumenti]
MTGHVLPPPLHLRGVVLPEGEVRDLWCVDGRLAAEPVPGATTVAEEGWILPGLVDAHCHVGLESTGAVDRATTEQHALTERDAGVLLLRDAGSPADTRWIDGRDDLPRIVRAGRHIARPRRYLRDYADEVEPDGLVAAVERQAAAGDGWIKLVGDWIDREQGDLAPLWPVEVARAAVERAHELGCRVTVHVFGEQAVTELVGVGVDGVEHGTGLDEATIALMARRGVALVPTLLQLENFPRFAEQGRARFPRYARHMEALHARRWETFGRAVEAGVPVYAGTDAGGFRPHGTIAGEVEQLARVGGASWALGAASWRARSWLGHPGLETGAPADLLVLAGDPRTDLTALRRPRLVVLRGRVVRS